MSDQTDQPVSSDVADQFADLSRRYVQLQEHIRQVIIGQHEIVEQLLVAFFCQGHTLIVGVPGLAKTLLVRTLAQSLDLSFSRIQFTPDMMPSDILGTELIQTDSSTGQRRLEFLPGPVFANIVLADEINRTPPKTQAALLECMAERQVSIAGETRPLDSPFLVVATQNPIEQEGTYPLPEAQLDRFMFSLWMDYPTKSEERLITADYERLLDLSIEPIFDHGDLQTAREMIAQIPVTEHVIDYAVDLARATRPDDPTCPEKLVRPYIAWGAGPRAAQYLVLGAKCLAALEGRPTPSCQDVRRIASSVLRHRLVVNYQAIGEQLTSRDLVQRLLHAVEELNYD